jgi:tRNA threonylcarbamoyl adenosine modification protein (Sua5/YciO/YrdC/YwlC family)
MLLSFDDRHPQPRKIQRIVELLRDGEIISYPTDTGYGLGCDMNQKKAVEKLFLITQRPKNKPGALLAKEFKQVSEYCYIGDVAYRVARRVLPGPYTLILEASKAVPRHLQGKRKEVGIRIPDHPIILAVLEDFGTPLLNVTANDHLGQYLDDPLLIEQRYGKHLGAVVDAGLIPENPSTIVDLTGSIPEVLRLGVGDPEVFF